MQSIITKYLGPSNFRGARIKAKATGGAGSMTRSYDYALNTEENHRASAKAFAKHLQWPGTWIEGDLGDGMGGYVYVCINSRMSVHPGFTVEV